MYEKLSNYLVPFERKGFHPDELPLKLDEEVLIIGMGRTGTAAYLHLEDKGLAMVGVEAKIIAAHKLRKYGFKGVIISHSSFAEDAAAINAAGANYTHQTFSETGVGLAKHLLKEVDKEG